MAALVKTTNGVSLQNLPSRPLPSPDWARVAIQRVAICRTDIYAAQGRIPVADGRILGHEAAGVVVEASSWKVGQRVIVNPLLGCGLCAACRAFLPHDCWDAGFLGIAADGAFATEILIPENQLVAMPDTIGFEVAAYAEPLAAALSVLRAELPKDGRIGLMGGGRIADLTAIVMREAGFQDVVRFTEPAGHSVVDHLVETCVSAANFAAAAAMIRPGGTFVLKSRCPGEIPLELLPLVRRRLLLKSVFYGDFAKAVNMLPKLASELAPFIGNIWPLSAYEEAFADATASEETKIYFDPTLS